MALLWMDGFNYGSSDLAYKYDVVEGTPSIITSGTRRPDSRGLYGGNYIDHGVKKIVQTTDPTIMFGVAIYFYGFNANYSGINLINNNDNVKHITIKPNSNNFIEARRGAYNETILATSTVPISFNTWYYLSVKVTIHDSAGSVLVKLGDTTIIDISGVDTKNGGTAGYCNCVKLSGYQNVYFQDFYIADTTGSGVTDLLGDVRVDTIRPSGAGSHTDFTPSTGSNYENVDDADFDESTYNTADAVDEIDTYAYGDLDALGSAIHGVAINSVGVKTDAGTVQMAPIVRIGSTDYQQDAVDLLDTYKSFQKILELNPADAAAWEETDINGAEFGVKRVA